MLGTVDALDNLPFFFLVFFYQEKELFWHVSGHLNQPAGHPNSTLVAEGLVMQHWRELASLERLGGKSSAETSEP